MIFDGELRANEALRQDDLAFGTSRNPVREALGRLNVEGLVTFRPRRGHIVAGWGRRRLPRSSTCAWCSRNMRVSWPPPASLPDYQYSARFGGVLYPALGREYRSGGGVGDAPGNVRGLSTTAMPSMSRGLVDAMSATLLMRCSNACEWREKRQPKGDSCRTMRLRLPRDGRGSGPPLSSTRNDAGPGRQSVSFLGTPLRLDPKTILHLTG
jgi:Bacterial regulatory proteins, gntR family